MAESWHSVALAPDCNNPEPEDGQILLAPGAADSAGRLVVRGQGKVQVVKGGTHAEEHPNGCARPELIASLAEGSPPRVEYHAAGFGDRLRLERTFQLKLAGAIITFVVAALTLIVTINAAAGDDKASTPLWLVTLVAVLTFLGALVTFVMAVLEA